ncbi:hypothetical protein ZHAS_00011212 [Anopheles sinensis]|uniref:Uncharacterized protein n=1 Tax=Anopheles sinensis TaxID=74873 RepID=A0A084VZM0_ANOSI|nr:hypothetical protein ZHAS_00011212 [Anopheles sinensis]
MAHARARGTERKERNESETTNLKTTQAATPCRRVGRDRDPLIGGSVAHGE